MPTLMDISRRTGLSVATVSNALNGRSGYSLATRQLVRRTADELGYSASPLARGLLGKSTKAIGVSWSLGRPRAGEVIQDMSLRAWNRGYTTFMMNSLGDPELELRVLRDFIRRGVDGVIFQACAEVLSDRRIAQALKQVSAAVAVTDVQCESPVDLVVQDTPCGVRQLMDYWLATGRQRIGFVGEEHSNIGKISPLRQKLIEARLPHREIVLDIGKYTPLMNHFDRFWAALDRRFPNRDEPVAFDAILCASDAGACAVIAWMRDRGLRVPDDVAVVGVEDTDVARAMIPPLSSLSRQTEKLSETVEAALFRRMERPDDARHIDVVPAKFIWRESAGPKPADLP